MAEIAWQLRNCADFLIAPQTELPGSGTNYTMLYDNLCNGKNTKECAYNIVESFKEKYKDLLISCAFSVLDMSAFNDFSVCFANFLDKICNSENVDYFLIKNKRETAFNYSSSFKEYVDFKDFLSFFIMQTQIPDFQGIQNFYDEVLKSYDNLVLNSFSNNLYENKLSGLGINVPYNEKLYSYYNQNSDFYLDIYSDTCLGFVISKIIFAKTGQN